jgi:DNA-binding transcriptional LysR family regulator
MEQGSMSGAARRLGRSQPAVSMMITRLEDELGLPLFHRRRGKLEPLPEAAGFYEEVRRALAGVERTIQAARDLRRLRHGPLLVATQLSMATSLVPRVVSRFLERQPGALVRLLTRNSQVVHDLQEWQALDLGFAELPGQRGATMIDSFELDCVCVLPPKHPLADQTELCPRDLNGVSFVALHREHMTHRALEELFAASSVHWNVVVETEFFATAGHLAGAGVGVALVDPMTGGECERRGLQVRRFQPSVQYRFGMFHPRNRKPSKLAESFAEIFREEIRPFTLTQ